MSPALPAPTRPIAAVLAALALALSSCGGGGGTAPVAPADGCTQSGLVASAGYQCVPPARFTGDAVTVTVPALGPTERLAVLLVNAGGTDGQVPTVTVSGTGAAPTFLSAPPPLALAVSGETSPGAAARRQGASEAHEALRRWDQARLAALAESNPLSLAPAAPALPDAPMGPGDVGVAARTFCHAVFFLNQATGQPDTTMRREAATLRAVSPGLEAQFWVVDAVWADFQATVGDTAAFFDSLGAAYDVPIKTALGTYFGAETDVDANGQMMFVFAGLGSAGGAFPVGYFTAGDTFALDASPGCTGSASNHADVLYLTDPATFVSKGFTAPDIRDVEYPGTMAHELQHNVNYNERCRVTRLASCSQGASDADWVNEGLSMVSEDAAGYGLATNVTDSEFIRVGNYLRVYRDFSLTAWEGDPAGNYGGVHAFMRYWLDQRDPTFTRQVVTSGVFGNAGVEQVLGMPLASAQLRLANALLFSGETFSPLPSLDFDAAANWSPLHQKLKWVDRSGPTTVIRAGSYVDYTPLPKPAAVDFPPLRADGWGAYLTGTGSGGPATVTVTTTAPRKPHVLVVRFSGDLPRQ